MDNPNEQDATLPKKLPGVYEGWLDADGQFFVPAPPSTAAERASLYMKIAKVTGQMNRVKKNSHFGNPNSQYGYDYASWDDIAEKLNEVLGENNLAVIPHMPVEPRLEELGKNSSGNSIMRAHVQIEFTLVDGDTGATETRTWYGHADDNAGGEKVIPKAITYTQKTFYKSLFVISTGDEDAEGSDVGSTEGAKWNNQQPRQNSTPPSQRRGENKPPQKPPAQQPPAGEAPAGAAAPPPTNITDINAAPKTIKMLIDEADKKYGMDRDNVKWVLGLFDFPKDGKGGLLYNPERHDAMLAALGAWKETHSAYLEQMGEGAELEWDQMRQWQENSGVTFPTTPEALKGTVKTYAEYLRFLADLEAVQPDLPLAKKVLDAAGLSPWKPGKSDQMIATVKQAKAANEDVVEDADVEDVIGGSVEPVNDDELGDLMDGGFGTL